MFRLLAQTCYSLVSSIVLLLLFFLKKFLRKKLVIVLSIHDWERHFNIAKLCADNMTFVCYISTRFSRPRKVSGLHCIYIHSTLVTFLVKPICIMDSSIPLVLGEKWNSRFMFSFIRNIKNIVIVDTCDVLVGDLTNDDSRPDIQNNKHWQALLLKRADWIIARDLRSPKSLDNVAIKRIFIPDYICYKDYVLSFASRETKKLFSKNACLCYAGNCDPNIGDVASFPYAVANELLILNRTLKVYNSYIKNHRGLSATIAIHDIKNLISFSPVHFSKLLHLIRNSSSSIGICFTNFLMPLDMSSSNDYTLKAYNLFCPLKLQVYVNAGLFVIAQPGKYLQFILHRYRLGTCITEYDQLSPLLTELEKVNVRTLNHLAYNFSWEKNAPRIQGILSNALFGNCLS